MTDQHREKLKGEKALATAKAIDRKVVFIPRGITGDVLSEKYQLRTVAQGRKTKLNHSEVLKMLNDGSTQSEVARKFKITKQMVSYIKKKNK